MAKTSVAPAITPEIVKLQRLEFEPQDDGIKFSISASVLIEALGLVNRAIPKKPVLPIHGHVLVAAQNGALWLRAGGSDLQVRAQVTDVEIERPGAVTVPAKFIHEVVMTLGRQKLTWDSNDLVAKVTITDSAGSTRTVRGMPATDYPIWPRLDRSQTIEAPIEFVEMLKRTIVCAAKDETRQKLNSVNVRTGADRIVLAAVDGYHLAESQLRTEEDLPPMDVLIRRGMMARMVDICANISNSDSIGIEVNENMFHANVSGDGAISRADLYCTRLADTFVEYERMLPDSFICTYLVDVQDAQQAMRTINLYSRSSDGRCVLLFHGDKLALYARDPEIGMTVIDLKHEIVSGTPPKNLSVHANSGMIGTAFRSIPSEETELSINAETAPIIFRPTDPEIEYLHLVMPLHPVPLPTEIAEYGIEPEKEVEPEKEPATEETPLPTDHVDRILNQEPPPDLEDDEVPWYE